MSKTLRTRSGWLLAALVAGCGQSPNAAQSPAQTDSTQLSSLATARAGGSCLPGCAGTRSYDALSYDLRARYDWSAQLLTGSENVALALTGSDAVVELDSAVQVSRVHVGALDLPFAADAANKLLRVDATRARAGHEIAFTVEYTVAPSVGLVPVPPHDGDAVQSRVIFTDSEPDRGAYWLVANHHPADRARFSFELTVDADEDVISNGERLSDHRHDGRRTVRYALAEPIPTYLMAFAAGQLVHTDRVFHGLPLSLWYRRGLQIDPKANLDAIEDAMTTFDKLLGPYPWPRYSEVLLPEYPGGMENATITFDYEESAQGTIDFTTTAHELSHHWFGDWVTMHDFDDVWVKEGMATVLESEADRARRDTAGVGRLFGVDFDFRPIDAIVDDTLHGQDKYTSGPYERAAWMITQIRATVGEEQFWRSLRKVLRDYRLGSITGEQFVREFAPALSEADIEKIVSTLTLKPTPAIDIAGGWTGDGTQLTLTLTDPSLAIISPLQLRVIDSAGNVGAAQTLAVGTPLTLTVPTGGYLATDERDVHPDWAYSFTVDPGQFYELLGPLELPSTPAALAIFDARSAGQQERTFYDAFALLPAADFSTLYAGLDSTTARHYAEILGCENLEYGSDTLQAWTDTLTPILQHPALNWFDENYTWCTPLASQLFGAEFVATAGALTAANSSRFEYLMSFDYGATPSLATLSPVATSANSMDMREYAVERLAAQAEYYSGYQPPDPATLGDWQSFITGQLAVATTDSYFEWAWPAVTPLADAAALPVAGAKLHAIDFSDSEAAGIVCGAYGFVQLGLPAAWTSFQDAAQPWTSLSPATQALLAAPDGCATMALRKPAVERVAASSLQHRPQSAIAGALANRPDAHVGQRRLLPASRR